MCVGGGPGEGEALKGGHIGEQGTAEIPWYPHSLSMHQCSKNAKLGKIVESGGEATC